MKRSCYLLFLLVMILPSFLVSQTITGKLVDQSGNGLSGLQLKLYISPKIYDATSVTGGLFTFNNITSVKKDEALPMGYAVSDNYPNPFNPKTRIVITLPGKGRINVSVFNLLGQNVLEEINKYFNAGDNQIDLELNGLPNGIYFARIILDGKYSVTKKLMLMYGSLHLSPSSSGSSSFSRLNKSILDDNSSLATRIDSIVVTGSSIIKKVFTNLPSMIGNSLYLGSLAVNGTPGKIEMGLPVDVSTTSIGSGGGIIKVSKPGTPIDGMEITIPPNSFTTTKNFKISYAEIKSHQFSQYFNPVSPMISVSYEGGYSKDGMSVKIPIKLPAGQFAMGFLYDDKTGKLEGMPIESLDNNFITVDTRSFTTASSQLNKRNGINDVTSIGNMVISSISESLLNQQTIISSGFTPGVDDWEFINYGSYLAPGGHCAGQSMTAMWYFYEKKLKGAKPLFHLYDQVNTKTDPKLLWQDNPLGYRFASTIQEDFNWATWVKDMNFRSKYPALVWNAFALSMLITGEPQNVLIRNSHDLGGHAMIVHKINIAEGKLYIADPNYPNNINPSTKATSIRTIDYVNGKFNSYFTGLSAADVNSTEMDQISYFGKTSYIDWGQIGKRWTELENETIGNDRFPKYNLKVKNEGDKELVDQLNTNQDTLKVYCKSTESVQWLSGTDHYQSFEVYDDKGNLIVSAGSANKGIFAIPLKPGSVKYAIYIMGAKNNSSENYVDFKWITIIKGCPGIPTVTYDFKTYNTAQIGKQCWLKENLDVGTMIQNIQGTYIVQPINNGTIEKYCYNNDPANCAKYGGLYLWQEAMQFSRTPGAKGICPEGWHIPTYAEFGVLQTAVNNDGNSLKALGQGNGIGTGTNTTGFSALLAGDLYYGGTFELLKNDALFWSSTESESSTIEYPYPYVISLNAKANDLGFSNIFGRYGYSIRCLKN